MFDIAKKSLEAARSRGAKEVAAAVVSSRDVNVAWRDGKVETIKEATSRSLNLELYVDGRYGAVSTSDLRAEAVERFVGNSVAMIRALAKDPHRQLPDVALCKGRSTDDLEIADGSYDSVTPTRRRQLAEELEVAARSSKSQAILSVSTSVDDTTYEVFRVASDGFEGARRGTMFSLSANVSVKDSDGRRPEEGSWASARNFSDLPPAATVGKAASERALGRLGAKKVATAAMPMIVQPRAGGRLVSMLLGPLNGGALQQKRSFLDGKVGSAIGSPALSFDDNPLQKRGLASRTFDNEGLAAKRMVVVKDGVLRAGFIDTYYGRKMNVPPTTGGPSNLAWKLGTKNLDALLKDVGTGILITAFLGGNSNGATGDFSLGVGGFYVRNGKIAEPVSEMNIAGNQLEFWKRLAQVGNDPFPHAATQTPTLVFDSVQFAGV
jgi:PmbA protein